MSGDGYCVGGAVEVAVRYGPHSLVFMRLNFSFFMRGLFREERARIERDTDFGRLLRIFDFQIADSTKSWRKACFRLNSMSQMWMKVNRRDGFLVK